MGVPLIKDFSFNRGFVVRVRNWCIVRQGLLKSLFCQTICRSLPLMSTCMGTLASTISFSCDRKCISSNNFSIIGLDRSAFSIDLRQDIESENITKLWSVDFLMAFKASLIALASAVKIDALLFKRCFVMHLLVNEAAPTAFHF